MPPAADDVCEVIITAPDPDWLVEFTRRLVTDRLCASGHNFAPIRTIYRWHGQVHDTTEGRVALRTRRSLVPQIVDRAKREHPYEVPSVVAVPIIDGGPRLHRLDPGPDRTTGLSRAASSSRGGSLVLPPRPGWRDWA
jgi:periplasmic divalent cation tolerance protein